MRSPRIAHDASELPDGRIDAVAAPPDELQPLLNPSRDAAANAVASPEVPPAEAVPPPAAPPSAKPAPFTARSTAAQVKTASRPQRPALVAVVLFLGAIALC